MLPARRTTTTSIGAAPGRRRPPRTTLVLALGAAAAAGLTGCGASVNVSTGKTIDLDEVKAAITKQYAAQGIPLSKLDCKDDVAAKKGAPISCSAVNAKGTILNIRGSVTAFDGDGGRFNVRTVSAAANGTVIADKARSLLETKYGQKMRSFTCPATVPIPTTPSVTCDLTTLSGKQLDTKVTLSADGDLNVEVADEATNAPGRR